MSVFITNSTDRKSLKDRIRQLTKASNELKFLVGFFYFSGWQEFYKALKDNPDVKLKILIGLQVEKILQDTVEFANFEELNTDEIKNKFFDSLLKGLNNNFFDNKEFYSQINFFLQLIQSDRLIIRKTREPNHAKLYLFKLNEHFAEVMNIKGSFIAGSSNLTHSGLFGQNEFNIEVKDYGFEQAEEYFDKLWETSVKLTEDLDSKRLIIDIVNNRTQVAEVSPFEAYAYILKNYLDALKSRKLGGAIDSLLAQNGFKKFKYQADAVYEALNIIDANGGVIIADVVGLGKSVIASLIATQLGMRGIVLCPPSLMGNKNSMTGWYGYLQKFSLYNWDVESIGKLETLAQRDAEYSSGYKVVIIDEAHRFRNQDTAAYEALSNFVRDKIVILLTATPFNNSPADIFSLLKLFVVPGKSSITINDDLESLFQSYNYKFKNLSFILKNYNSSNFMKQIKAEKFYTSYIGKLPINTQLVRSEVSKMANHIKNIISPVVIRRNRLDLMEDEEYKKEIKKISVVKDPEEIFFALNKEQSKFYDKIISDYFGEKKLFKGAIYRPILYEKNWDAEDMTNLSEEENRIYQLQKNLYDFMRRILVKRFESSFGAFEQSIKRFLKTHKMVLKFIKSSGIYFLDRSIIEKVYNDDEDAEAFTELAIAEAITKFKQLSTKRKPKHTKIYHIDKFIKKEQFFEDIENDIRIFEEISAKIKHLNLINDDPKRKAVINEIQKVLKNKSIKTKRKIVLFSEYVDTISYLEKYFSDTFGNKVLICKGRISKELAQKIEQNFNAQLKKTKQKDKYDILITSDKLSEGVNLNRAGLIINYDIPWNPTRVIQRVGRINRIGEKVFDELWIYNFFPTEQGADIVKSRQIAQQKMFLIHNALGEDTKIFDPKEEPTPSALYNKLNANPDNEGNVSFITVVRNEYKKIKETYPDVIDKIEHFPVRIKTAKKSKENSLVVLKRKGIAIFSLFQNYENGIPQEIDFQELLNKIKCEYSEPKLKLSPLFWNAYEELKKFKPKQLVGSKNPRTEKSLDVKALNSLKSLSKQYNEKLSPPQFAFIQALINDIKNYKTLSQYTLRRLILEKNDYNKLLKEIEHLRQTIGDNFLDPILEKIKKINDEVIIAIENQK